MTKNADKGNEDDMGGQCPSRPDGDSEPTPYDVTPRPLRILWVNHRDLKHPKSGGAEVYLWELISRLRAPRFEHTFLCETARGLPNDEVAGNVSIRRRGGPYSLHLVAPFYAVGYDVVIESVAHAVPFFTRTFTRIPRITILYHVHNETIGFELSPLTELLVASLERLVALREGPFIAISENTRAEAARVLKVRGPIHVIAPGIDPIAYHPGEKQSPPMVVYLGRLKKYKRVDHVIRAFGMMAGDYRLAIVGDGDDRLRLERLAKDDARISFLGRLPEESKRSLLRAASVNVIASAGEGFGLTAVEASASGTPTVAYANSSLTEVVSDGVNGFLVQDGNVQALASGLTRAINDASLRAKSIDFSKRYDWNRSAASLETILHSLSDAVS